MWAQMKRNIAEMAQEPKNGHTVVSDIVGGFLLVFTNDSFVDTACQTGVDICPGEDDCTFLGASFEMNSIAECDAACVR